MISTFKYYKIMIRLKVNDIKTSITSTYTVFSPINSEYLYLYSNLNDISCFVKNKYIKNLDSEKIQISESLREYLDIYVNDYINITKINKEYLFKLKFVDIFLSSNNPIVLHRDTLLKKCTNTFIPNFCIEFINNICINLTTSMSGLTAINTEINFIEGNNVKIIE